MFLLTTIFHVDELLLLITSDHQFFFCVSVQPNNCVSLLWKFSWKTGTAKKKKTITTKNSQYFPFSIFFYLFFRYCWRMLNIIIQKMYYSLYTVSVVYEVENEIEIFIQGIEKKNHLFKMDKSLQLFFFLLPR